MNTGRWLPCVAFASDRNRSFEKYSAYNDHVREFLTGSYGWRDNSLAVFA